jgi:para-nitrobenzyl esterase
MLAQVAQEIVVETTLGRVAGRAEPAWQSGAAWPSGPVVHCFRGIPYAAAPIGPARFRPPLPAPPWAGTRSADRFGPAAPQGGADPGDVLPGMVPDRWDEDCLTVNVWRPADTGAGPRPVLVWVHGGGFTTGASGLPSYDCARLCAEQGVVVVSFNYRLGALGFLVLDDPSVSTNCGLTDQVLALRWLADNAAAFGGDPGNVTVFGESAGAGSILHLLASPDAAGLFRRAILQSPGVSQLLDTGRASLVTDRLLHHLGIPAGADGLRAVPAGQLVRAQQAAAADVALSVGRMPFHPVHGSPEVPRHPVVALEEGSAAGIDLVIGTTAEEMRLYVTPALTGLGPERLVKILTPIVSGVVGHDPGPEAVGALVGAYEKWVAGDGGGPAELWAAVLTDGLMRLPAERALAAHAGQGGRTYSYSFSWRPTSGPGRAYGACHAIDVPFTFGTFDRAGWGRFLGADAAARQLGQELRAAWGGFARDGAPAGWPEWDPASRRTLVLDTEVTVADDPLRERREAWEALV